MSLRIGTRGSPLALWQANHVADRLRPLVTAVELVQIQTEGDRDQSASLAHIGGRGVFTNPAIAHWSDYKYRVLLASLLMLVVVRPLVATGFVSGVIRLSVTPWIETRERLPSTVMSIVARSTVVFSSSIELKIS